MAENQARNNHLRNEAQMAKGHSRIEKAEGVKRPEFDVTSGVGWRSLDRVSEFFKGSEVADIQPRD